MSSMLRRAIRKGLVCALTGWAAAAGCARGRQNAVVIATSWTAADQRTIETAYRRWAEAQPSPPAVGPFLWVQLEPGADLDQVAGRAEQVDVLLGGPVALYERLGQAGRLSPIARAGLPLWCVAKRSELGFAINRRVLASRNLEPNAGDLGLAMPVLRGRVGLGDPRHDFVTFALAKHRLETGEWARGYAELVLAASHARPIGRTPGAALASLERGEVAIVPAVADRVTNSTGAEFEPMREPVAWFECAALRRGAPHAEAAQAFLNFLVDREPGSGTMPRRDQAGPADALLADLLGATVVDAQDELRAAGNALAWAQGDTADRLKRETWLAEAPPWPPASVVQIRRSDELGSLLETLAEQVAPDPAARAWLWKSWQAEPEPLDGTKLAELATAAGGRLTGEPRFRAWLRAEWTAWARQRYLSALRLLDAEGPRS